MNRRLYFSHRADGRRTGGDYAGGPSSGARRARRRSAGAAGHLAGSARRSAYHVPHLRAAGAGHPARRRRHSGARSGDAVDQGRERRLGSDRRPGRSRHLSLQLQRRWRHDDRSAQPVHQRVEQQRLEPRQRARLGLRGHEERAARRRRCRDLLLHRARPIPPHARLHAARLRAEQRQVSGVLPAARRRRQRRFLDLGRPRRLHPRQPDRREEGEADDRRHACRPHAPRRRRRLAPLGGRRPTSS